MFSDGSGFEKNNQEVIHIALSIWDLTDTYNRHAGVAMVSILENTKNPVHFHLLYDRERSNHDMECARENYFHYKSLEEKYDTKITFHHTDIPDWINEIPFIQIYTASSVLRFFILDLFPDLDKVLYLDTDIVVRLDIAEIWGQNIGNFDLAARSGKLPFARRRNYQRRNINYDNYFNSGVILFNLKEIRSKKITSSDLFSCLKVNQDLGWPDQDVLNMVFKSVFILPEKYNLLANKSNLTVMDGAVFHFAGRVKPWNTYLGGVDKYYWEYLLVSPWGEKKEEVMQYLLEAPHIDNSLKRIPQYFKQLTPVVLLTELWNISIVIPINVIIADLKYLILFRIFGQNSR